MTQQFITCPTNTTDYTNEAADLLDVDRLKPEPVRDVKVLEGGRVELEKANKSWYKFP